MTATRFDFIRHGQPEGGNRFRGNGIDDPLSPLGWEQMRRTSEAVLDWQRVVSSPMRRCIAFAEWLAQDRGLPLTIEHEFREVGFGNWEGLSRAELRTHRRDEYAAFYRDPVDNRPPGAEPLAGFGRRVAAAMASLVADHAAERLLIVAHAGVIRAAIGQVLQSPPGHWYRAEVDYAGLTRFVHEDDVTRLVIHNWRPSPL